MSPQRKLPPDHIIDGLNTTIGDFWSWAYSDNISNANRGVLAEYIVGVALGITDEPRIEWNAYDFLYQGKGIEVKAAGFVQTWAQNQPSRISFDIAHRKPWDAQTNTYATESIRAADCYVFCLHGEQDRTKANALDISQWLFFVLPTSKIKAKLGKQKSVSLSRLQKLASPILFAEIKAAVDRALSHI